MAKQACTDFSVDLLLCVLFFVISFRTSLVSTVHILIRDFYFWRKSMTLVKSLDILFVKKTDFVVACHVFSFLNPLFS